MNVVILSGNLTRDPDQRAGGVVRFTVASDRSARKDGSKVTDFIECVAFDKVAAFIADHFQKGDPIFLRGTNRPTSWVDKDGNQRKGMDVHVLAVEFTPSKKSSERGNNNEKAEGTFTRSDFPGLDQPEGPRAYFAGYRQFD